LIIGFNDEVFRHRNNHLVANALFPNITYTTLNVIFFFFLNKSVSTHNESLGGESSHNRTVGVDSSHDEREANDQIAH
jgi:hypothetical protein